MQVILMEKVANLGDLGDIVRVKDGFARNFLIPQRKAKRATDANRAEFEARQKQTDAFSKSHFPEGAQLCSKCSTAAVVMMDGCMTCLNCGDSKCG